MDENKERSIYVSLGNLGSYFGLDYEKGIGLFNDASVAAVGYDGKYIDIELSALTFGIGAVWKMVELKHVVSLGE